MMRVAFLSGLLMSALPTAVLANELACGFLLPHASLNAPGPEAEAARQLAGKLSAATPVIVGPGDKWRDSDGQQTTLAQFGVLWYHQGDSAERSALHDAVAIKALRAYVADGGGLFLSGAALAMVHDLGIEPIRPRISGGGQDAYQASIIPVETAHPIFSGLDFQGIFTGSRVLKLTERGYPAFSDFHGSGGPKNGMLLAKGNAGSENPLVEYALGKGRIIAMGWRLPHYADSNNAHHDTLERLTGNILSYLADSRKWQKLVLRADPTAPKPIPGVRVRQWRSLALAIKDLGETFGADYPAAQDFLKRLAVLKQSHDALPDNEAEPSHDTIAQLDAIKDEFDRLKQEALLANPLLDFDELLLIRRGAGRMGQDIGGQGVGDGVVPGRITGDEGDQLHLAQTVRVDSVLRPPDTESDDADPKRLTAVCRRGCHIAPSSCRDSLRLSCRDCRRVSSGVNRSVSNRTAFAADACRGIVVGERLAGRAHRR